VLGADVYWEKFIVWYFIHISHPANGRKEVPEKFTNKHVMPWIKILNKI